MVQIAGLVLVCAVVLGALFATGGGVSEALPFELALICGAALGALLIGNSAAVAKDALAGFGKALKGCKWRSRDMVEALALAHGLFGAVRRGGLLAIEDDIERPLESDRFARAPAVRNDAEARELVCDAFRLMALDPANAGRLDARLEEAVGAATERRMRGVGALGDMADALPALGIVAAVLGIIKTMGAIDQSDAVVGAMIASALLGTFLGVFLAYGVVGPIASRFGQVVEEEAAMLHVLRAALCGHAAGLSPRAAVELGRAAAPAPLRPSPDALDRALEAARFTPRPGAAAA